MKVEAVKAAPAIEQKEVAATSQSPVILFINMYYFLSLSSFWPEGLFLLFFNVFVFLLFYIFIFV